MTYEVNWLAAADREFRDMWWEQKRQSALVDALRLLRQRLSENPYDTGESRQTIRDRVAIEGPLRIYFRVMDDERMVMISHMDWFGKHPE
jgi:mRNA-degrading endonuclease RelE of RelBE toxin-antitoxin system